LVVPGWDLLQEELPPYHKIGGGLSLVIAMAILFLCYRNKLMARASASMGVVLLVLALTVHTVYYPTLQQWTVRGEEEKEKPEEKPEGKGEEKREQSVRIAVGFGLQDWTLTPLGETKRDEPPRATDPFDIMMRGGYHHGAELYWEPWTIIATSTILLLAYSLSVMCWGAGWGVIARLADEQKGALPLLRKDAAAGHGSVVDYYLDDGLKALEQRIAPLGVFDTLDGLVLRARVLDEGGGIRHYSVERISYRSTAGDAPRVQALGRIANLRDLRTVFPKGRAGDLVGVIRDVLADFKVEVWEKARFEQVRQQLGLDQDQVRAACAYVLAEHLVGCAASGSIDDHQIGHIIRLSRGLQTLTEWLYIDRK